LFKVRARSQREESGFFSASGRRSSSARSKWRIDLQGFFEVAAGFVHAALRGVEVVEIVRGHGGVGIHQRIAQSVVGEGSFLEGESLERESVRPEVVIALPVGDLRVGDDAQSA